MSSKLVASTSATVYSHKRELVAPPLAPPKEFKVNQPNLGDGRTLLKQIPDASLPLVFFDPQYRGVSDSHKNGNKEQSSGNGQASTQMSDTHLSDTQMNAPMSDESIKDFIAEIGRILIPSGHLMFWLDKSRLCSGVPPWLKGTKLNIVDMIVWHKEQLGRGYRTRDTAEYLVIIQKDPKRAKGVWRLHDIPDVWTETKEQETKEHEVKEQGIKEHEIKKQGKHPHQKPLRLQAKPLRLQAKPLRLQAKLIEATTNQNDLVLDPAAGSYSVLKACQQIGRNFIGCDINHAE